MFGCEGERQMSLDDYFKPSAKEKPKLLVDFINGMGTAQYTQIKNTIAKTVETNGYDINKEQVDRITNSVSIWLLGVGREYQKYLEECLLIPDNN